MLTSKYIQVEKREKYETGVFGPSVRQSGTGHSNMTGVVEERHLLFPERKSFLVQTFDE